MNHLTIPPRPQLQQQLPSVPQHVGCGGKIKVFFRQNQTYDKARTYLLAIGLEKLTGSPRSLKTSAATANKLDSMMVDHTILR